jgi:hypothetical protein
MAEPTFFYAGDTVEWTKLVDDYTPTDGWTLSYVFAKGSVQQTVTASDNGDGSFAVAITAAESTEWDAGVYYWQAKVTLDDAVHTVGTGQITVKQALSDAATYDGRSVAKVMLENIEAYLIDANNITAASYSIGGRSLSRWSRSELLAERERLRAEVRAEEGQARVAAGLGNPRRLYVRFDR